MALHKKIAKAVATKAVESKAPVKVVKGVTNKKKTISKMARNLFTAQFKRKGKDAAAQEPKVDDTVEKDAEAVVKGPKGKVAKKEAKAEEANKVKAVVESEDSIKAARAKELKAMPVADLKAIIESKSLTTGKKDEMVAALVKAEAKGRAEVRIHEAKVRAVLEQIKAELDAKTIPELKELCATKGLKLGGDKNDKVARILELANKEGEVEKIMAQNVRNARREEVGNMDKEALLKHCAKAKIDPLVHEVMVERLYSHEVVTGHVCLAKPEERNDNVSQEKLEKKLKELKAMDMDALKKLVKKTEGVEGGKKDVMVAALLAKEAATEAEAARKKELKALGKDGLKELCTTKGLPVGNNTVMMEAVLADDAKAREDVRKQKDLEKEVAAKKAEEFSAKNSSELKDLCTAKGLKIGGGKDEKVERLVQAARDQGEIDQVLLAMAHARRREELSKFDKVTLKSLCDKAGIDTIIKDVLVERVISSEFDTVPQPAAKKARVA